MKRAIWLPNWIGDAIMATPAIRHLRTQFPNDSLTAIFRPPNDDVFAGNNLLDEMILDQSSSKFSWKQKRAFLKQLRREQFDEIILLTNSLRTAAVAKLAGIPSRIGFQRDLRGWLLTSKIQPKSRTEPNPEIDEYLRLVHLATNSSFKASDLTENNYQLELATTEADEADWNDFSADRGFQAGEYICLNSGGAFGAAKHWSLDHFVELAGKLVKQFEMPVVMLCGPAELELANQFTTRANHPQIHSLAEQAISVGLSKAVVKHSRLMITTDSGPRHFAAAFGVPVITLFGPTHIAWSETYYEHAIHLQHKVDCGPCQKRICPLKHHRCMQDLSVERVFQTAQTALSSTQSNQQRIA